MAYVLAGGRGNRLMELTDRRAKPAVYFGGKSRIIDFALSNALNSGIRRIAVATQYKAHSLIRHLQHGWNFFRPERNESFDILPASQRVSETMWYLGAADAVYQNIDIIESYAPQYMVVLAGDHIYKMDTRRSCSSTSVEGGRDGGLPGSLARGGQTLRRHAHRRGRRHPLLLGEAAEPPPMPGKPDRALCSMGVYVFETKFLFEELSATPPIAIRRTISGGTSFPISSPRQSGRASFLAILRLSPTRSRCLLARRRDGRRLLGGQHRFDRHRSRSRSLRPRLADLDLRRNHAAGQIRARHGRSARSRHFVAGLRRLRHFRRGDITVAAIHRRPRSFLFDHARDGRVALCADRTARPADEKR